jgi:hypothetical protein
MKNLANSLHELKKIQREVDKLGGLMNFDLSPLIDMLMETTNVFGDLFKQDEEAQHAVLKTMTREQKQGMIDMFEQQYLPILVQYNKTEKIAEIQKYIKIVKENLEPQEEDRNFNP